MKFFLLLLMPGLLMSSNVLTLPHSSKTTNALIYQAPDQQAAAHKYCQAAWNDYKSR